VGPPRQAPEYYRRTADWERPVDPDAVDEEYDRFLTATGERSVGVDADAADQAVPNDELLDDETARRLRALGTSSDGSGTDVPIRHEAIISSMRIPGV